MPIFRFCERYSEPFDKKFLLPASNPFNINLKDHFIKTNLLNRMILNNLDVILIIIIGHLQFVVIKIVIL